MSKYQNKKLLNCETALKSQVMPPERNTQSVRSHLSSDSGSEHSLNRAPLGLTLEDLEPRESVTKQRNIMHPNGEDPLRRAQDRVLTTQAGSLRNTVQETKKLTEKLNSLREQNAYLTSQNHVLLRDLESVQVELAKSKSKVRLYESALGMSTSKIPDLQEQIVSLKAQSEAQEKALRSAEDELLENRCIMTEKEQTLQRFREQLKEMKMELYEANKLCKRAEKQRNEALVNAEELTRAFQQYKKNVTEKIEKIQAEGELLRNQLLNCEKERQDSQEKCTKLETEVESSREHLRKLTAEKNDEYEKQKCSERKNAELISLLTQSNQRVLSLESELKNKEKILEENSSLLHETRELRKRLAEIENLNTMKCGLEPDSGRQGSQLKYDWKTHEFNKDPVLEDGNKYSPDDNIIAELRTQLSKKEAENRDLQVKLVSAFGSDSLHPEPVKLSSQQIEEEKYLHLENVSKELQAENMKLSEAMKELQRKLVKAQTESTKIKQAMAQRTSQFRLIQEELLEKASKSTKLEQEMTKKSLRISSLQKLLEEKTESYLSATSRTAELEEELQDLKAQIHSLEENITKEHQEVHLAFEKSKHAQIIQHNEQLKQIEHLQSQLEMKNLQIAEQNLTIKTLQEDTLSKQQQLESVETLLRETRKEMDCQTQITSDAMKALENQVEQEAVKVRHLEAALVVCKEELGSYLQQLEDNREHFANQVKKKSEEVHLLQKEIKLKNQSLRDTNEENMVLQQNLQQQQQMLQQGNERIGDLEEMQAQLHKQVSKLEFELEKHRAISQEKIGTAEGKLQEANQELNCNIQQINELNRNLAQMKCEFDICKEKLSQAEGQLLSITVEGESKNSKLSQLELIAQKMQIELDDKTQLVSLLQERVLSAEKELKKKGEIELQLQHSQRTLQDNVKHVEELQETLTKTHLSVEEKQVMIQALTEELRTCKNELEEKDLELLDMDQALKDRNWELKQRAAQLTQLDMSIQEHRAELEQKIIQLEKALKKSELETEQHKKQISSLDEKLQETQSQLTEKDFGFLEKDQYIVQLQKELEKHQQAIKEMEQTLKGQRREGMDLNQQLKQAQEGLNLAHLQLVETQQQLAEAHKESDRLTHKLEEMDLLFRDKMQHLKQDLDDARDTICNLKTELEARNEVIKATNEVLILKESELTRLKARISGYERSLVLKGQTNPASLSPHLLSDYHEPESSKLSENWNMHSTISDQSLNDIHSIDLSKTLMESPLAMCSSGKVSHTAADSLNDTSFNPLEYAVNDDNDRTSDCPDLGTLSGMLKYIKQEMKLSDVSQAD